MPKPIERRASERFFCVVMFACAMRLFDASYSAYRTTASAAPDNLIYYNMLLEWWQGGDSPLGHTLLPSPYFIDIALQFPLALVARDFEHFAYALALVYSALLFGGIFLVARRSLQLPRRPSALLTCGVIGIYYLVFPLAIVAHSFVQNHTSEVFCTLFVVSGAVGIAEQLARVGQTRWRLALGSTAYVAFVAVNVASSAFFITTFVVPSIAGILFLLGTRFVSRRGLVSFVAATVGASALGLTFDAALSTHVWPVRGDLYRESVAASLAIFGAVVSEQIAKPFAYGVPIAAVAAVVVALVLRRRITSPLSPDSPATADGRAATVFLLVFGAVSLATCVAMPIGRGAFISAYELRYVQLPCILATFFAVASAIFGVRAARKRFESRRN